MSAPGTSRSARWQHKPQCLVGPKAAPVGHLYGAQRETQCPGVGQRPAMNSSLATSKEMVLSATSVQLHDKIRAYEFPSKASILDLKGQTERVAGQRQIHIGQGKY